MDDIEMVEFLLGLQNSDDDAESTSQAKDLKASQSSSYFPNIFAEALVPVNPSRWPAFVAGSAMESDQLSFGDKVKTPLDNLVVASEFLETSQSDVQWRSRLWQVSEDTAAVNMASETGGNVGSFAAGVASNKFAVGYLNEMVETEVTKTTEEKLNFEIFKQVAREKTIDPSTVRGTGLARQFVPWYMQGDLCERPSRNSRPNWWNNNGFEDDETNLGSGPTVNPKSPSNDDGALNLAVEPSTPDSSSYPDESISNTDNNDGNEGIFGKFFGFLGFGEGVGVGKCASPPPPMSEAAAEQLREDSEKTLCGWFFGGEGSGGFLYNPDPSHSSNNPPLFLDGIPPSDQS